MAENSLLQRLDGIDARFEEVATLITDPAVIADMGRYVRLNKEYKELEGLCAATKRYRTLLANIEEAKSLLEDESDADMRRWHANSSRRLNLPCRNLKRRSR